MEQNLPSLRILLAAIVEQTEMIAEMMTEGQLNSAMVAAMWRDELVVKLERNSDTWSGDSGIESPDGGKSEGN